MRRQQERHDEELYDNTITAFDETEIRWKQKRLAFIYQKCLHEKTVILHDKLKFKGVIYSKGDFVQIYDLTEKAPYTCKISEIIKLPSQIQLMPFIEVEWCFKKQNLPQKKYEKYLKYMSVAEIFPSQQKCYLYIESIKRKCDVLEFDAYALLGVAAENILFVRSNYNHNTETLEPSPQDWFSPCICKYPSNPDLLEIQCVACHIWFHEECVLKNQEEGEFSCDNCKKKKMTENLLKFK